MKVLSLVDVPEYPTLAIAPECIMFALVVNDDAERAVAAMRAYILIP
jgi:hypothetical protein